MSEWPHRLAVSPAGTDDGFDVVTGEQVDGCDKHYSETVVAYLPHQCDQWVVGWGTTAEVIAQLGRLRDGAAMAIAYLEGLPEVAT